MGYTKNAVIGASWIGGLRASMRGMTFLRYAILWRILTAAQFGLFSITSLVLALLEILTETGINVFLIQKDIKVYLNTAWVVSIVRGVVISFSMLIFAPFIVSFFNTHEVYTLILLASLIPFIRGFINPAVITFQKELHFNKEFYFRFILFFIESFSAIIIALYTKSAVSLVYALLISAILEVVFSLLFISPKPTFRYNKKQIIEIFSHGKWVTTAGIFNYLFQNGDNIAVGRLLGTIQLGYYDAAYKMAILPITEVAEVITKVTLPVYTKFSDDITRLRKAFIKTFAAVVCLTIPFGIFFFMFPEQVIKLVLGEKALPAAPVLQVLATFGIIRAVAATPTALFYATGRQRYVTIITSVSFLLLLFTILPLIAQFGLLGAAYSAWIASMGSLPVVAYLLYNTLRKL